MHADPARTSELRAPSRRRWLACAVAATLLTALFAARGFTQFDRTRLKIVERPLPQTAGAVRVVSDAAVPWPAIDDPVAVIVRIANHGGAATYQVVVDGTRVCELTLSAQERQRADCAARLATGPSHEVLVSGPETSWSLDYLEIARHHGNSTGLLYLVVLPAASRAFTPPGATGLALTWIATFGLLALPRRHSRRRAQIAYRVAAGVAAALLLAIATSPWLSRYTLIVSAGTYWRLVGLIALPGLVSVAGRLCAPSHALRRPPSPVLRPMLIAVVAVVLFSSVMTARRWRDFHGNYSGLLQISERNVDASPLLSARDDVRRAVVLRRDGGYDGQFAYFESFDPLMRKFAADPVKYRGVVDAVPYRYGRIGFSWLTIAFSLNRWPLYPQTMAWLILAGIAVCAFIVAYMAERQGSTPALGLLVALIPGFWQSVQTSLPEPIAAALLIGGLFFAMSRRWLWAAPLFAMSLLVRETGIVAVVCAAAAIWLGGRRREAIALAFVAVLPMVLWRGYVGWVLFPDWGMRGFLDHPADLGWPLSGFLDLWRVVAAGQYFDGAAEFRRAATWMPFLLIAGASLALVLAIAVRNAISVSAAIYGLIAVSLNYEMIWVHPTNAQRGTYELFAMLILATLALGGAAKPLRVATATFWALAGFVVLFGVVDATFVREALSLPF